MTSNAVVVRHIGRWPYMRTLAAMQQFNASRTATTIDEIWLLEHDPVFTQGRAGSADYLLFPGDIPVVQSDRAGQVTHHAPGQITGYLMVDIKRGKIPVKTFVALQEQAMIDTLKYYGVNAHARPDAPGVYVASGAKIGSIGLRVKQGRTYHGINFNVDMDMSAWQRINPCGLGVPMTQLYNETDQRPSLQQVAEQLADCLTSALQYRHIELSNQLPPQLG